MSSVYEPNALPLGHTGSHSHRKQDNNVDVHWVAGKAFVKFWPGSLRREEKSKYGILGQGHLEERREKKQVKYGILGQGHLERGKK